MAERRRAREPARESARRTAETLLAEGRVAEGITALERLAEQEPDWTVPHHLLARAFHSARRLDDALAHLDWLTFHGIETAQVVLLRAAVEFGRRRLDAALDFAIYARRLDERIAGAHALIGDVYYRRRRLADAEEAYRDELASHPRSAPALAGLAAVALRRGDFEGAVDFALSSLEQDFRQPATHYRLGVALARLGRAAEALTARATAAKLRRERRTRRGR